MALCTLILFSILLISHECDCSILDWLSWKSSPQEFSDGGVPLLKIPFEELTPEEKFLVEGSKITGLKLNQLDACQHKLIMKLKSSCASLSDEELAKLSVNLLNCQADLEGRKTYPCNKDMSLRDCTSEMDPETWNAYHIMSNRARAVCYVARQEQFRALSEMTVNRLVTTARSHLQQMAVLNENQGKLETATQIALDKISRSQHDVLSTYSRLKRLESELSASLTEDKTGMERLAALLDNERNEIILILSDFKKAIENAEIELKKQKDIKFSEHEKVLKDLLQSQEIVKDLNKDLEKIDTLNAQNFEKLASQFDTSQKNLKGINKSLNEIFGRLETLEKIAENKTSLVLSYIGYAGDNIDSTLVISIHLVCLSSAMVVASFLDLPGHLRALLIVSGIANTYLTHTGDEYAVPIFLLYLTLAAITVVYLAVIQVIKLHYKWANKKTKQRTSNEEKNYTNNKGLNGWREPHNKVNDWLVEKKAEEDYSRLRNGTVPYTPILQDEDGMSEHSKMSTRSRTRKNAATPSRSIAESSTSGRKTSCSAVCLNGQKCKRPAALSQSTCRLHQVQR